MEYTLDSISSVIIFIMAIEASNSVFLPFMYM